MHKNGPIIIYDTENRNIKASEIPLTYDYVEDNGEIKTLDENSALYNYKVVIAKKYNDNSFYVTRREWGYFTHSGSNSGINRKFSELNIAVPKDGVVLLFPNNAVVEIPDINDVIQFDFDYKQTQNGTRTGNGFGTWKKLYNLSEPGVEQEVLDCYSVTDVNKLNSSNDISVKGPIIIYNENNSDANFNEIPAVQNMIDKNLYFRYAIATKKSENEYTVKEVMTKSGASLKSINDVVPKDGIVLIWHRDNDSYGDHYEETKFPEIGDTLVLDFDYTKESNGIVYRYKNIESYGKKKDTTSNGLTPIGDEDLLPNEKIIGEDEIIKISLFDYNENINDKYFEVANKNTMSRFPFFAHQQFDSTTNALRYEFQRGFLKDINKSKNTDIIKDAEGKANRIIDVGRGAIVKKLPSSGYPALAANNESIGYLFGENDEYDAVESWEDLTGLFIYDEDTGEYRFDSREHCAQLSDDETKFDLYNARLTPGLFIKPFGNFMPFNDIRKATKPSDLNQSYFEKMLLNCYYQSVNMENNFEHREEYANFAKYLEYFIKEMTNRLGDNWSGKKLIERSDMYYDTNVPYNTSSNFDSLYTIDFDDIKDYHFGITVEARFKTYEDNKLNGKDVIYKFDGDDDVWVYIDDVLFLDLGGCRSKRWRNKFHSRNCKLF